MSKGKRIFREQKSIFGGINDHPCAVWYVCGIDLYKIWNLKVDKLQIEKGQKQEGHSKSVKTDSNIEQGVGIRMEQINITCTDNDRTQMADILAKTDKMMKVAFVGTNITLTLNRTDVNKPYVGSAQGLEFVAYE